MRASSSVIVSHYSGRAEHALAEQREVGAAVHGALEELEAIHLALHLPITPSEDHRGEDGVEIAREAGGKRPELAPLGRGETRVQRIRGFTLDYLQPGTSQQNFQMWASMWTCTPCHSRSASVLM